MTKKELITGTIICSGLAAIAAIIAAVGLFSILSDLTTIPPDATASVSLPEISVM